MRVLFWSFIRFPLEKMQNEKNTTNYSFCLLGVRQWLKL